MRPLLVSLLPLALLLTAAGSARAQYPQQPYPQQPYPQQPYPPGASPYRPGYGNPGYGQPGSGWQPMPQGNGGYRPPSSGYTFAPPSSSAAPPRSSNHGGANGVIGFYGGLWDQKGAPPHDQAVAFGLDGWLEAHQTENEFSLYLMAMLGLGGSHGLEQRGAVQLTLGWQPSITPEQGPVFRAGLDVERWKSDRIFFTQVALPMAEIGYQYAEDGFLLEAVGLGGGVLYGQFTLGRVGDRQLESGGEIDRIDSTSDTSVRASRSMGTTGELGGALRLRSEWVTLSVQADRVFVRQTAGGPIDEAAARFCLLPYKLLALCADGLALRGDQKRDDNDAIVTGTALYGGITLGVGVTKQK